MKPVLSIASLWAIISVAAASTAAAQNELPTHQPVQPDSVGATTTPGTMTPTEVNTEIRPEVERAAAAPPLDELPDREGTKEITSMYLTPEMATIYSAPNTGIWATGGSTQFAGMMGVESGQLNFAQRFGQFDLTLFGAATKYGYYRGLTTSWGFGGNLTWHFHPDWSITVFGEYYTPVTFRTAGAPFTINSPAMGGYRAVPRFGGYIDRSLGAHWGIRVGAQAYRDYGNSNWELQPIVMPYYKFNSKVSIGVDVGGILYQILSSKAGWDSGNPTIAPPRASH